MEAEGLKKFMISRAGKSTNNLYQAFQDKQKHKNVQSKVAQFMGVNSKNSAEAAQDHKGYAARGPIANIIEQERRGRRRILDGSGAGSDPNAGFSA